MCFFFLGWVLFGIRPGNQRGVNIIFAGGRGFGLGVIMRVLEDCCQLSDDVGHGVVRVDRQAPASHLFVDLRKYLVNILHP